MRVDCSLGAHELGRHGMIPAHHAAPRRSFHEAIPVADQLGQAVQLDQVRVFRIGFRSAPCRHMDSTARCAVAREEALRKLQPGTGQKGPQQTVGEIPALYYLGVQRCDRHKHWRRSTATPAPSYLPLIRGELAITECTGLAKTVWSMDGEYGSTA